jgi:hypothetical protein
MAITTNSSTNVKALVRFFTAWTPSQGVRETEIGLAEMPEEPRWLRAPGWRNGHDGVPEEFRGIATSAESVCCFALQASGRSHRRGRYEFPVALGGSGTSRSIHPKPEGYHRRLGIRTQNRQEAWACSRHSNGAVAAKVGPGRFPGRALGERRLRGSWCLPSAAEAMRCVVTSVARRVNFPTRQLESDDSAQPSVPSSAVGIERDERGWHPADCRAGGVRG